MFLIAASAVLALCLPSVALASDPNAAFMAAEVGRSSVLSIGELAALIAVSFIPALVMIARERRAERRGQH